MSNFMALRQLIADLINTLLLAILKLSGGRGCVCLCVVCVCGRRACMRVYVRPSGSDGRWDCAFRPIRQQRRVEDVCGGIGKRLVVSEDAAAAAAVLTW